MIFIHFYLCHAEKLYLLQIEITTVNDKEKYCTTPSLELFLAWVRVDQIQISVEALQQSNNIYGDKVLLTEMELNFLLIKID